MFSFSPFGYDLFDDSYPFSNGYYVKDQHPSLFKRSSSFRQPCYYRPSYFESTNRSPYRSKQQQLSDEEDEYDPFLHLFASPRNSKRDQNKELNDDLKQNCVKQQKNLNRSQQNDKSEIKSNKSELSSSKQSKQINKELDSQRFDSENDIEFKFHNYKCEDPSAINVSITKDGYIVLKTNDGYYWKSRIPTSCDLEKASCTCDKKILSLKLPKKVVQMEVESSKQQNSTDSKDEKMKDEKMKDETFVSNDKMEVDDDSKHQNCTAKDEKINDEINEIKDQTKVNEPVVSDDKKVESNDANKNEEFDPDEPIVEDIIEDY